MDPKETATILIVDDEPTLRLGLAGTIKRFGYGVITAENGNEGIAKAKEYMPDLILSDVMMPHLNGFEMRRQLSADPKLAEIPFIFLTARSASEDRITGIRAGADDYVGKPFETEELMARIEAVLRRVRREQERGKELVKKTYEEEFEKMRREILQNFRHELRTPLGNVMMSLQMAVDQKFSDPQEQADFIRIAHSSVDRLEAVMGDIILLADIDQQDMNLIRQAIDPTHHILQPVEKRLKRYEAKNINFIHNIKAESTIKAPRREFVQALVNLADNAFKFGPANGSVTLTIRAGEYGGATIEVQDEGPGIPAHLREKVFERFYQVSQGDAREHQGLGIGLTVARAIFEKLGGSVKILDSEKGCHIQAILPDIRPEDITYG